jgi:hypothetical protein
MTDEAMSRCGGSKEQPGGAVDVHRQTMHGAARAPRKNGAN